MIALWIRILEMSLTASLVILVILPVRWLLKKAPKLFSYALWAVVLFRLLCPVAFSSSFSLLGMLRVPLELVWNQEASSGSVYWDSQQDGRTGNASAGYPGSGGEWSASALPPEGADSAWGNGIVPANGADSALGNGMVSANGVVLAGFLSEHMVWLLIGIWLTGLGVLLCYSLVSVWKLRRRLVGAVRLQDNIWLADRITSPFVMGIWHPQIYLPSTLSGQEQSYILLHEQTHIRRRDYLIKPLAFLALGLHWFNPLVWLAFVLAVRDMEMSCDESVVRQMGEEIRCDYSASLLNLTVGRNIFSPAPLAFGEGDTRARIRNILSFKKPAFWMLAATAVLVAALGISLLCNPRQADGREGENGIQADGRKEAGNGIQANSKEGEAGNDIQPDRAMTAEDLAGEKFVTEDGISTLLLRTDGKFEFNRHIATNYNPRGSWVVEGETLRLTDAADGTEFLFQIQGNTLVFEEGTSIVEQGTIYRKSEDTKWALRPMIRVNGILYLDTGKAIPAEIDESAVLGTVTGSVAVWERPWTEGQTNFGQEGSKYAYCEDGVVVLIDHEWYFFERNIESEDAESLGILEGDTENPAIPEEDTKNPINPGEDSVSGGKTDDSTDGSMWVPTMEEAIYTAILDHNRQMPEDMTEEAPIRTASWVTLGNAEAGRAGEEPDSLAYYIIGLFQEFTVQEPDISGFRPSDSIEPGERYVVPGSSCLILARVSLEEREDIYQNHFYRYRDDYWQTDTGDDAASAASAARQNGFPEELLEEASKAEQYQMSLLQECYAQAVRASGLEAFVQTRIDQLLNIIMSSPMTLLTSSNPYDYLEAHPEEVKELLAYGEETKQYCDEHLRYYEEHPEGEGMDLRAHLLKWLKQELESIPS